MTVRDRRTDRHTETVKQPLGCCTPRLPLPSCTNHVTDVIDITCRRIAWMLSTNFLWREGTGRGRPARPVTVHVGAARPRLRGRRPSLIIFQPQFWNTAITLLINVSFKRVPLLYSCVQRCTKASIVRVSQGNVRISAWRSQQCKSVTDQERSNVASNVYYQRSDHSVEHQSHN